MYFLKIWVYMISRDEYVIVNLWHGIHSTRNIWLCQHVAHWTVPLTRAGVLQFQEKQFSQPATQRFWNYIAIKLGGNSRLFIKPGVLPGGWWERHLPSLFFCCCLLALNYFPLTISWGELGVAHCLGEMWGQYPLYQGENWKEHELHFVDQVEPLILR